MTNDSASKPPLKAPRRLLAVMAHPDDETFGIGGTLALYARQGVECHVVTATGGEVGSAPADLKGSASVAEMREHELRCAAAVLGLASVSFLGYRDSGMAGTPDNQHPGCLAMAAPDQVARQVAAHIRRLRPQVLITHDPSGGYGHPDHIATHWASLAAVSLAGDPGLDLDSLPPWTVGKVYYHVLSLTSLRWMLRVLPLLGIDPRHFGRNRDIDLVMILQDASPVHAVITLGDMRAVKAEASACHSSQSGGATGPWAWLMRWVNRYERFTRAIPEGTAGPVERDLFAGIEG